jgi:hypothetical protein
MNAAEPIGHTPMMQRPEREFSRELPIAEWKTYAKTYALTADGRQLMKAAEQDLCDAHETITALGRRNKLGPHQRGREANVACRPPNWLGSRPPASLFVPPTAAAGDLEIELMSYDERHTGSGLPYVLLDAVIWTPNPAHLQP